MVILLLIIVWAVISAIKSTKRDLNNKEYIKRIENTTGKKVSKGHIIFSNIVVYLIFILIMTIMEVSVSFAFDKALNIHNSTILFYFPYN